jgi:hypothetical protein
MTIVDDKIQILKDIWGYLSLAQFIEDYCLDSTVPGICMNAGCNYTDEVEPDQLEGWCEVCDSNTVKSLLLLAR